MNILDIIIVILLAVAGIAGFRKGIIAQVCGIAGLLLGVLLAFRFSGWLAGFFEMKENVAWIVSFAIILVMVILALYLAGFLVRKLVRLVGLGIFDRLGGFALGVVKWGLVLSLLMGMAVNFIVAARIAEPELVAESKLYPPLRRLGDWVFPYILDAKEKYVDPEIDRLNGERDEDAEEFAKPEEPPVDEPHDGFDLHDI